MNSATSILGAIYRRKHVVLLVMLSSIGVGMVHSTLYPADYVAAAEILVPMQPLGLSVNSEGGNVPTSPLLPEQREGNLIGLVAQLRTRGVLERVSQQVPGINPEMLRKNLIGDVTKEGIVEYRAFGRTAEEAVLLANNAVKAFGEVLEEMASEVMESNLATFKLNETKAWGEVEVIADEISAYMTELGSADYSAEVQAWLEERTRLETSRFQLELRYQEAKVQRPVIEQALEGRPEFIVTQQQMSLPNSYASALDAVTRASSALAAARLRYMDRHTEVVRLKNELALAEAHAAEQAEMVLSSSVTTQDRQFESLTSRLVDMEILEAGYQPQRDAFDVRIAELDGMLGEVPGYLQRLNDLQSRYREARGIAEKLSTRRSELEIHVDHGLAFALIDEHALASVKRAKQIPTQMGIIMFTGLAGMLFGIFVALGSATIARMRLSRPY